MSCEIARRADLDGEVIRKRVASMALMLRRARLSAVEDRNPRPTWAELRGLLVWRSRNQKGSVSQPGIALTLNKVLIK